MHHQSTATLVQIYTLSDPDSGAVRYVGQSADAQARLRAHLGDSGRARSTNPALAAWLLALRQAGKKPMLRVVQTVRGELAGAAESAHMALHRQQGAALLNIHGLAKTRIVLNINGLQTGYARMTIIPTPALVSMADERGCSVADVLCQVIADTVQNAGLGQASRPNDDYMPLRS